MSKIPTVNVTASFSDAEGRPVRGAVVCMRLTTTERYEGYVVPTEVRGVTDATGKVVLAVWPNELGTESSEYLVTVSFPEGYSSGQKSPAKVTPRSIRSYAVVPNSDCLLHDIMELPPYDQRGAGEIIDSEVASYAAAASASADDARVASAESKAVEVAVFAASEGVKHALEGVETAKKDAEASAVRAAEAVSGFKEVVRIEGEVLLRQLNDAVLDRVTDAKTVIVQAENISVGAVEKRADEVLTEAGEKMTNARAEAVASINNIAKQRGADLMALTSESEDRIREAGRIYGQDFEILTEQTRGNAKKASASAAAAVNAANKAETSAKRAEAAAQGLERAKSDAVAAAARAEAAAATIESNLDRSETAATTAVNAAKSATSSAQSAATSAKSAKESAELAQTAIDAATQATEAAATIQTIYEDVEQAIAEVAAETLTEEVISAAVSASTEAAETAATTATEAAETATAAATSAAKSAATATTQATAAATSAAEAAESASEAAATATEIQSLVTVLNALVASSTATVETVTLDGLYSEGDTLTLPVAYVVGDGVLELFYCGTRLVSGTQYEEVGDEGDASTTVTLLFDTVYGADMVEIVRASTGLSADSLSEIETLVAQAITAAETATATAEALAVASGITYKDGMTVADVLDELLYEAIDIESLSVSPGTVEAGTPIPEVTLTWTINKTPTSLTLNGDDIDVDATEITIDGDFNESTSFTLIATDEKGATDEATVTAYVLNGLYYGVSSQSELSGYDNDTILSMSRVLTSSKSRTVSLTADDGEYYVFAWPVDFGVGTFIINGEEGGFTLLGTVSFTNSSGYTDSYYVYRSTESGLGTSTITVS